MNTPRGKHVFFLVPVSREAGLTSMALGLVRALQIAGLEVGFFKPIAQPEAVAGDADLSGHFARTLCGTSSPEPIAFGRAVEMVGTGRLSDLMEEVVAAFAAVDARHDVTVVEGLIPDADIQIASRLNMEIIRSLGADVLPVLSGEGRDVAEVAAKVAGAIEQYAGDGGRPRSEEHTSELQSH